MSWVQIPLVRLNSCGDNELLCLNYNISKRGDIMALSDIKISNQKLVLSTLGIALFICLAMAQPDMAKDIILILGGFLGNEGVKRLDTFQTGV